MRIYHTHPMFLWPVLILAGLSSVRAEVKDSSADGFTIQDSIIIAENPIDVYNSIVTRCWPLVGFIAYFFRKRRKPVH